MIIAKNVSLSYQKADKFFWGLDQISCTVPRGRITTFLGKSGAGKTSLISCIAQLQQKFSGLITCGGRDVRSLSPRERACSIGFVFQQFNLFPTLTVLENCVQPLTVVLKLSPATAQEQACEALQMVGVQEHSAAYPRQLSVGQQQRVAIARALCFKPAALLFDEPTSALDPENTAVIARIIKQLAQQGIAIGVTSHDMAFVRAIFDRVYFMQDGAIMEQYDKQQGVRLDEAPLIASFLA
jgi:ABC-type polar amino acid transport system ATPase subunit